MDLKEFTLNVFPFQVKCLSLGDYHAYWLNREAGERNPKFDRHSGQLLSFKTEGNRDHPAAVANLTMQVRNALASATTRAEFVIIPSHAAGKVSTGLVSLVSGVCQANRLFSYRPLSLNRTSTIKKLSHGGNRSESVHMGSMKFYESPTAPATKILIDDVMTTGNSIAAAARLVKQAAPNSTVVAIVLGRTVHE